MSGLEDGELGGGDEFGGYVVAGCGVTDDKDTFVFPEEWGAVDFGMDDTAWKAFDVLFQSFDFGNLTITQLNINHEGKGGGRTNGTA
jgi:hypothetical protein